MAASLMQPMDARDPRCFNDLGNALKASGQLAAAAECYEAAIELDHGYADAYFNLGNLRHVQKEYAAALMCFARSIELSPMEADAHNNLGAVLLEMKQTTVAIRALLIALTIRPEYAEALFNMGNAMAMMSDHARAIPCFDEAIRLRPGYAKALQNRGAAQEALGELEEAINSYRLAQAAKPECAKIGGNLASAMAIQGHAHVIDALQQIVNEEPGSAELHWNLAIALLLHGRWEQGWEEYEWRWKWDGFPSPRRNFAQPQWRGEDLAGATILLHAEQGLGDTLQFIRYVPAVEERGGRVLLEVQPGLHRLMRDLPGVALCLAQGDILPQFDVHCPLMSLPKVLGQVDPGSGFAKTPYLHSAGVPRRGGRMRVGLAWAGSPKNERDRVRSIPAHYLRPFFEIEEISFVSLQKNAVAPEIPAICEQERIADAADFADSAEIVASLDLVITVDTAVAHLAGAMGKPVWVLLANMPDWRWGLRSEVTAWYPSARLFRGRMAQGWDEVIGRVVAELRSVDRARSDLFNGSYENAERGELEVRQRN